MACSADTKALHLDFAELHCLSNFSFLRGASHPEELVEEAARLGYLALALTDECSLAGVVRAHLAARKHAIKLIIGSELVLQDGLKLVLLATERNSYGNLSALITLARRQADKGSYRLSRADLAAHFPQACLAIWLASYPPCEADGRWLKQLFANDLWLGCGRFLSGQDQMLMAHVESIGQSLGIPVVACNDVHMHRRSRQALQDTLTAIRLGQPLAQLGYSLFANGERHLRPLPRLAELYPPEWLQQSQLIAERCRFSLDELRYEYPRELTPSGHTPSSWLRHLTEAGALRRWPQGVPDKVHRQIEHELALIAELIYEPYFLTVHDIVRYAREQGILCQGRGSAANSAVCYCLGITEVDPSRMNLLFERFLSRERNEAPDIDVDFEHERREQVIQYIYQKYGRHRAALAATVITYRTRSAVRDVGKALGLNLAQIERLADTVDRWDGYKLMPQALRDCGFDPDSPTLQRLTVLVEQIQGFPRHLSQHVGGFVIARDELSRLVPVENAAMVDRTVIQWEKDDLEAMGLLKVDVLALGMLSAIRKTFAYLGQYTGRSWALADIPAEDPAVYAMLQQADSIGVFQVESRAQMTMLPRLKPANYYDLVIEIAIVRPGPIQGEMVHPYLARRKGLEPVDYPSPEVKTVLERTLGIPIFQEQVMQLAMVAAGFTAGEADELRRAMAAWKRKGGLEPFERKLLDGMRARGYSAEFAQRIFQQIKGFGDYGFPESHSASFALLAYVSAWLKRHHPAAFCCALLNSQPMGFYGPSQLVQDARRHGVEVRPVDVQSSLCQCSLEFPANTAPALRLGFNQIKGLSATAATKIVQARGKQAFANVSDLSMRADLSRQDLEHLATADALRSLAGNRHRAFWAAGGVEAATPVFGVAEIAEATPLLKAPKPGQEVLADYASTRLSLREHPLGLLRERLRRRGVTTAASLWQRRNGSIAQVAGLVICRQRPMTAAGVTFVTLEDETGQVNLVVWPATALAQRKPLLKARLLSVTGTIQQEDGVLHLVAGKLEDWSNWIGDLESQSRDFH
ncbi:Error-prone repair homolog of DNA polymerase III alpha subunit (EC 2.7.7.7) [Methylomonas albis]|uniref:Error-prone DNA polymerase n=1 Tax=Methylomonas albis TaxID=1854563 RepID=A0ABR9CXX6_9GAMM|nr:error-prone DNA polymerase [Methylomonas albis]MBD9355700.1 error-prone DNA polymerase [Methylomonas albis]CAD6878715.1 Error-prone repair homolog of DNA polymerase III alpha subunit (EC 2.7.7.7) [Methylomonas albis]